jgi:hypothetical protein
VMCCRIAKTRTHQKEAERDELAARDNYCEATLSLFTVGPIVEPPWTAFQKETPILLTKNPTLEQRSPDGGITIKMVVTSPSGEDKVHRLVKNIHVERQYQRLEDEGNALSRKRTKHLDKHSAVKDLIRAGSESFLQEQKRDPALLRTRQEITLRPEVDEEDQEARRTIAWTKRPGFLGGKAQKGR